MSQNWRKDSLDNLSALPERAGFRARKSFSKTRLRKISLIISLSPREWDILVSPSVPIE